ncbi:MAG: sensor histidine kinase [Bacilli bacterium]
MSALIIYATLFVIEILGAVSIGFSDISALENSTFDSVIGLILIRTASMIFAYLVSIHVKTLRSDYTIPRTYYFAIILVLFGTLYFFCISLETANLTMKDVLFRGLILVYINLTMIITDEKIYTAFLLANEKQILEQQTIAYEQQAAIISQSTATIQSLQHDMKNHLYILQKMYEHKQTTEIQPYLTMLINEIDSDALCKTNNFIVDSIINFKLRQCQCPDVKLTLNIFVPEKLALPAYDINVILSNLLDNAITAMMKSEAKTLDLSISYRLGNLIILCDNSFIGNLNVHAGKLKTTKQNDKNHGLGLANIYKIVDKHSGQIHISYTKEYFSTSIVIPLAQK